MRCASNAAKLLALAAVLCAALARAQEDLVFEAELCRELTPPWRPVQAEGASAGLALAIPEGAGSSEAFTEGREGRARFDLPAGSGGERELWLRVYWNGNCSNSLFVLCQPERRPLTVDSYTMHAWHWVKVPDLRLPPGEASVQLINREDGIWVDQLCVRAAGQPAPQGALQAATAWPAPGAAVPAVSLVPAPGGPGVEALPPTEYLLHHTREPRLNLPRQPLLVVFPGQPTPLLVWLRRNRPSGLPASLRLEAPEDLLVEPPLPLTLVAATPLLECLPFSVRARPSLPRGLTSLTCRLETADGLEQVRAVRVLRPYRWLVSQALRLNPAAGLDQLAETDAAVLAEPLGTAHGLRWHEAEPADFTAFGLLDLRRAVSAQPFVQAYALARCSAAAGPAVLDLTHDDWIRVWVNGECVFSSTTSAPSTLTRVRVPVILRAGDNDLLVRCAQLKNYWEFGLVVQPRDEPPALVPPESAPPAPASPPAAYLPEPLPRWAFESIVQDLPELVRDVPAGQGWTVFAAACREGPLTPAYLWRRLNSTMQGLAQTPGARRHCAEALLELRRRVDLTLLPQADADALRSLTFRDRVAFLSPDNPLEAAAETLAASCWAASRAEAQALQVEVVRLYLYGDGADEAEAYLAGPAADLAEGDLLRGVVALYRGDLEAAATHLTDVRAEAAGRYAGWLLSLGRATEAEWLLRRVPTPSVWNRLALATACVDQRRFVEGEALLLECLRRDDAPRSGWETAATELAKFHAARCSLPQAGTRLRAEAEALSHHQQPRRARLMQALRRLDQEAHEPLAALRDALEEADLDAAGYRPPARQVLEPLLRPALSRLLDEFRYAEVIDLCNQTQAVAPGLRLPLDVYRLEGLQGLGRTAAAEAVLARLLPAVGTDPEQARRVLSLLRVSEASAGAAEQLARVVLEGLPEDQAPSATAALARAYADAVVGRYGDTAIDLAQAIAEPQAAGRSAEFLLAQACFWVAQCLDLAQGNRVLLATLFASPIEAIREAALEVMYRRGTPGMAELLDRAHDLDATQRPAALEAALRESMADSDDAADTAPGSPQILPTLTRLLTAGLVEQIQMDPAEAGAVWVVQHGSFPFCIDLGHGDLITRFEDALRPFGEPLPVGHAVAFLHGRTWIGTDRGLFCYQRDADAWDRLRLPGADPTAPVSALSVVDERLQVTWTGATGRQMQGTFTLAAGAWETVALPAKEP